jgi:DNA-directed RNA polymerase specialized sigma24 family protein
VVYAEFIKRGVEGMPDIGGEPASAWQERLLKLKTRAGDRVPRGYGLAFAKKVWGIALVKARDPNLVEDVMVRAMEKLLKKPVAIDEGVPLQEAEGFIIRMVKNDLLDQFRAQKHRPQLGLGEKDEEGDYSGDVLDTESLEALGDIISPSDMQEILRDAAKIHPSAPAYIKLRMEGYNKNEIARGAMLPHMEGVPAEPQAITNWEKRWFPKIKQVFEDYLGRHIREDRKVREDKKAALEPGYGMDGASLRIRQGAYNIAKDISTGAIDVTVSPRSKQMAKKYFDLEDKSGSSSQRESAARDLAEQLDVELNSAKISVKMLEHWTESFSEAAGVHHNLSMTE